MAYLNSEDILVFPAVARANEYQRQSRLMTEESLTRYFKTMWNNGSFVISSLSDIRGSNPDAPISNGTLEFVIDGYYVKVADFSKIADELGSLAEGIYTLYAKITTSTTNGYTELNGEDNGSSKYTGVEFTTTLLQSGIILALCEIGYDPGSLFYCRSVRDYALIDGGEEQ